MKPLSFWKSKIVDTIKKAIAEDNWQLMFYFVTECVEKSDEFGESLCQAFQELYVDEKSSLSQEERELLFLGYTDILLHADRDLSEMADAFHLYFEENPNMDVLRRGELDDLKIWLEDLLDLKLYSVYTKKRYDEVATFLLRLLKMGESGKILYEGLLDFLKTTYSRRMALMAALEKGEEFYRDHFPQDDQGSPILENPMEAKLRRFYHEKEENLLPAILSSLWNYTFLVPVGTPVIKPGKTSPWKYPVPEIIYMHNEALIPLFTSTRKIDPQFFQEVGYEILEMPFQEVLHRVKEDPAADYPLVLNPFTEPIPIKDGLLDMLKEQLPPREQKLKGGGRRPGPSGERRNNVLHLSDYQK